MKKSLSLIICLLFSFFSIRAESLSEIGSQKQIQQRIGKEIQRLKNIDIEQTSLNDYLDSIVQTCEKSQHLAKENQVEPSFIEKMEKECYLKIDKMENIGDLQTIIDIQISQLQELQSSANFHFFLTKRTSNVMSDYRCGGGCKTLNFTLLPFAVIADVILLPFTFIASFATGF